MPQYLNFRANVTTDQTQETHLCRPVSSVLNFSCQLSPSSLEADNLKLGFAHFCNGNIGFGEMGLGITNKNLEWDRNLNKK